jgi:uncharacterized phosphatase
VTTFFLVRHGETAWNAADRKHGAEFDISMTKHGFAQIGAAAQTLETFGAHRVVTSPLLRAKQAANHIATRLDLPAPEEMAGFAERSFGAAEGMTRWQIEEKWPNRADIPGYTPDIDLARLALGEMRLIAETHPGGRIVVVTHAGVIKAVVRTVLGDPTAIDSGEVDPGSIWGVRESKRQLEFLGKVRQ